MEEKETRPKWLLSRGGIDDVEFCRDFYIRHNIVYQDGAFFSPEGRISDEQKLRGMIYRELRDWVCSGLGAKVESILATLRLEAAQSCLSADEAEAVLTIPVANGTYRLDRGFSPVKELTRYRLPVAYNPNAPAPERWVKFVGELLHEEDIPTLQEFMGYCLIPTTQAQKMLIITGKGGEGKSRVGVVMKRLLGDNMNLGSVAKVEKSPFARADLQHILLMVDDDLKLEALDQTNYIKSIITAELPMDLERKGVQSYQGKLNVRFLAFGNGSLQALHDRSHGFFRRQIILEARERDPNRRDDPWLASTLTQEAEGILLWAIQGLERLILNEFRFTLSRRARENLLRSMIQSNNIPEFFKSEGYVRLDPGASTPFRSLYETYRCWCADNALNPQSAASFGNYISQNQRLHGLTFTRSLPIGNGKYARGYHGIRLVSRV